MTKPLLLFVVTEDWYFLSHRLPLAVAALQAGYRVAVACRVGAAGDGAAAAIAAAGIELYPLSWQRRSAGAFSALAAIRELQQLFQQCAPAIVHLVALKPVVLGGLAAWCAGVRRVVYALTGLGYVFTSKDARARLLRIPVGLLLRLLLHRPNSRVILQNRDDLQNLVSSGVIPARQAVLIRGSGVDIAALPAQPLPDGVIKIGFVARMLADKGARIMIAAHQQLRAEGHAVELLMAGTPDPANPSSITEAEWQGWHRMPGVTCLGHVTDMREFWSRAHLAVLPSRREGLPKSLLEAAASARPIIASDVPGCREVVLVGENGYLFPPDNAAALADALRPLLLHRDQLQSMGQASRRMVERDLSIEAVSSATLNLYQELLA